MIGFRNFIPVKVLVTFFFIIIQLCYITKLREIAPSSNLRDILTEGLSPASLGHFYKGSTATFLWQECCFTSYATRSINRDDGYHNMDNCMVETT